MAIRDFENVPTMTSNTVANYTPGLDYSAQAVGAMPLHFSELRAQRRPPAKVGGRAVDYHFDHPSELPVNPPQLNQEKKAMGNERVVQLYVADLDRNIPLDKRLIWRSEPIFTDLTDNDLWFDQASVVGEKLAEHNKYRRTVRNKNIKDREEFLEDIRPKDLSISFTVLAQFQIKS